MFLNFKTVRNIRDLGGIPNKEGKFIKNKLLLRGGDLASISQDELIHITLKKMHITKISTTTIILY